MHHPIYHPKYQKKSVEEKEKLTIEQYLTIDQRIYKAMRYINDASRGHGAIAYSLPGPKNPKLDQFVRLVHGLRAHPGFHLFYVVVIALHLLLILFEVPSSLTPRKIIDEQYASMKNLTIAIETICVAVYFLDVLLLLSDFGIRKFFQGRSRIIYISIVILSISDLVVNSVLETGSGWFRYSRLLRPIFLILRVRTIRRSYSIAIKLTLKIMEVMLLMIWIVLLFALTGRYLMIPAENGFNTVDYFDCNTFCQNKTCERNGILWTPDSELCDSDGVIDEYVFNSFKGNPEDTVLALFLLLMGGTNYPGISMIPSVHEPYLFFYFFVFSIMGSFFLLNVLFAVMFAAYTEVNLDVIKADVNKEKRTLRLAFLALDFLDAGVVTIDTFRQVIKESGKFDEDSLVTDTLVTIMDDDKSGLLDEKDFMQIGDTIHLKIDIPDGPQNGEEEKENNTEKEGKKEKEETNEKENIKTKHTAIKNKIWDISEYIRKGLLSPLAVVAVYLNGAFPEISTQIQLGCACFFCFFSVLGTYIQGREVYWSASESKLDAMITFATFLSLILLHWVNLVAYPLGIISSIALLRALPFLSVLSELGLLPSTEGMTRLTSTFIALFYPFLKLSFSLLFVMIYFFAVLGMELYGGSENCGPAQYVEINVQGQFCNFPIAFFTLWDILATGDMNKVMYDAINRYESSRWNSLFFLSYYILSTIIIMNVLTTFFLDILQAHSDRQSSEESDGAIPFAKYEEEYLQNGEEDVLPIVQLEDDIKKKFGEISSPKEKMGQVQIIVDQSVAALNREVMKRFLEQMTTGKTEDDGSMTLEEYLVEAATTNMTDEELASLIIIHINKPSKRHIEDKFKLLKGLCKTATKDTSPGTTASPGDQKVPTSPKLKSPRRIQERMRSDPKFQDEFSGAVLVKWLITIKRIKRHDAQMLALKLYQKRIFECVTEPDQFLDSPDKLYRLIIKQKGQEEKEEGISFVEEKRK